MFYITSAAIIRQVLEVLLIWICSKVKDLRKGDIGGRREGERGTKRIKLRKKGVRDRYERNNSPLNFNRPSPLLIDLI
jgi:hypothetical protein